MNTPRPLDTTVDSAVTREPLWDKVLDRSVVLGYTRLGYAVRSRRWGAPAPGALAGRHVLVTGGTAGIGKAAARRLGELGATVHVLGHGRERAEQTLAELRSAVPRATFEQHLCDMGDLDAVRDFAASFRRDVPELYALLNNAGTMAEERTETAQGHELTLATQVLGPFLLTTLLADSMQTGGRVVFMSSGGMYAQPVVMDDLEYHRDYSGTNAYARTKRMLVDLTPRWDRTLPDGVTAHSMHPGWVNTPGVATYLPKFRAITRPVIRPAEEGADTLVWLTVAAEPGAYGGRFWHDRRARPTSYAGRHETSPQDKDRLWEYCARATTSAS